MRIGIDLGGTKTEAIVMDHDGAIIARERRPTPQADGYDAVLGNITALVAELETRMNQRCSVGIGTPGSLSASTGLLKNSNTVCLNGKPLKTDLESRLRRCIRVENDANCFALSEALDGAGQGHDCVFGVIMGTGVGGGIVFHQQLHSGAQHIAGEWGHNPLIPDGPPCYCGRRGCVETLISGPGVVADYRALGGEHSNDLPDIVDAAKNGDAIATAALNNLYLHFGRAIASVINLLDPDIIVLGGGLSNIPGLYTAGAEQAKKHVFNDEYRSTIVANKNGDSAGVRGAAQLWPAATD